MRGSVEPHYDIPPTNHTQPLTPPPGGSDAAIAPQLPPKGGPPRARLPRELQKVQQPGRLLTRRPQPPHQPRADLNACDRVRRQVRAKREPDRAASPWASRSDAAIARIAR